MAPALTESSVLQALKAVQDPDLKKDIVSLGFIKNLKINGTALSFDLELTTPACPVKDELKADCEKALKALGAKDISITMTSNVKGQGAGRGIELKGVRNVVAVASGKGGVGKSTVAANLALALQQAGSRVGLMDADVYGPSLPLEFGISGQPDVTEDRKIIPKIAHGIQLMSMGFLATPDTPIVWRGPMVHGLIQQFLGSVLWENLDYLIIDCPPGTGDAILTLTQSAPLAGAVIVTTPQEMSLIDARRGLRMFQNVKVPVLGMVENMSFFECRHCHEKEYVFSQGGGSRLAAELGVPFLGEIPLDPEVVVGSDKGVPILIKNPQAPASQAFRRIAGEVARQLSINVHGSAGGESLNLKWQ